MFAEITLWQSVLDKALGDEFQLTQDEEVHFLEAKLLTSEERKKKGKEKSTYRYGSTLSLLQKPSFYGISKIAQRGSNQKLSF